MRLLSILIICWYKKATILHGQGLIIDQIRHSRNGFFILQNVRSLHWKWLGYKTIQSLLYSYVQHLVWPTRRIHSGSGLHEPSPGTSYVKVINNKEEKYPREKEKENKYPRQIIPREPGSSYLPFYSLAWEVTWCDFHHTLLIKAVTNPSKFNKV